MKVFKRRNGTSNGTNDGVGPAASGPAPPDGEVKLVDDTTFLRVTGAGRFTLVDFSAVWCGPCRRFAPVFRQVAAEYHGVVDFLACDVDASPQTASLLQIRSVPTLVLFDAKGNEVGRVVGPPPKAALERMIAEVVDRFGLRAR